MSKLTNGDVAEICRQYLQGRSMGTIAREKNISTATVQKWIHVNGIESRSCGYRHPIHSPDSNRRYSVNKFIFDEIDSPEKAYWLGFLMADGAVSLEKGQVRLRLADKDWEHVMKFRAFMESSHPIRHESVDRVIPGKKYAQVGISINSIYLCKRMQQHGITSGRSFNAALNTKLDEEFQPHYWRGLVDGDGRCATENDIGVELNTTKGGTMNP